MTVLLAYCVVALALGVPVALLLAGVAAALVDRTERDRTGAPSPLTLLLLALIVVAFAAGARVVARYTRPASPPVTLEVP